MRPRTASARPGGVRPAGKPRNLHIPHRPCRLTLFSPIPTRFIDFGGPHAVKARSLASLAALVAVAALALAACGGASDTSGGGSSSSSSSSSSTAKTKLALVAYSTPQVVYDQVIPGFQKTAAGKGVTFSQSYGASGDQSRA